MCASLCNNREELTGKKFPSGNGTQDPPNWDLAHRPLSYHSILRHLCNKGFTGLTCYEKKKVLGLDVHGGGGGGAHACSPQTHIFS